MIPTELLPTFGAAAFAVILIPGPTVLRVTGYALAAARFRALLAHSRVRHVFNRAGAACLVVAGVYLASLNRGG